MKIPKPYRPGERIGPMTTGQHLFRQSMNQPGRSIHLEINLSGESLHPQINQSKESLHLQIGQSGESIVKAQHHQSERGCTVQIELIPIERTFIGQGIPQVQQRGEERRPIYIRVKDCPQVKTKGTFIGTVKCILILLTVESQQGKKHLSQYTQIPWTAKPVLSVLAVKPVLWTAKPVLSRHSALMLSLVTVPRVSWTAKRPHQSLTV